MLTFSEVHLIAKMSHIFCSLRNFVVFLMCYIVKLLASKRAEFPTSPLNLMFT